MFDQIKFETLAELQEKYPVGSVLYEERHVVTRTHYFYNEKDFNYFKRRYTFVEKVDDATCFCRKIECRRKIVEGYIYDGKFWYPAHNTWDGWVEYTEYDLKSEEEKQKEWEEDENNE
jgi:hypothetical protein